MGKLIKKQIQMSGLALWVFLVVLKILNGQNNIEGVEYVTTILAACMAALAVTIFANIFGTYFVGFAIIFLIVQVIATLVAIIVGFATAAKIVAFVIIAFTAGITLVAASSAEHENQPRRQVNLAYFVQFLGTIVVMIWIKSWY